MTATLALLEGTSIFAALCGSIFLWARPPIAGWFEASAVTGQTLLLALGVFVACYYNGLYEPRAAESLRAFVIRLPATLCLSFVLVIIVLTACPKVRIAPGLLLASLLTSTGLVLGLLLPLRTIVHRVLGSRPFRERVMILGTGPFADKLVQELEARHEGRFVIVGIACDDRADEPAPDSRDGRRSRRATAPR